MATQNFRISIEKGDVLFREDDPGSCAYIVQEGEVEVSVERDNRKVVLGIRRKGEMFGEMAVIDCKPRSATAIALTPCELIMVNQDQIQNRIDQTDPVLRMCLNMILMRFRSILRDLSVVDCESRKAQNEGAELQEQGLSGQYQNAVREIRIENDIRRALIDREFELHYQPIVDLKGGEVRGFEALVRWRHKKRGMLQPGEFIPTAEVSGLIVPISRWVFREACRAIMRFNDCFAPLWPNRSPLFMTVNLSGRDFSNIDFLQAIEATLKDTGVPPELIHLEITETMIIEQPEQANALIHQLREMGLAIAIDDFGTGYSSLSYLHKLPIDLLKIDRSFIEGITTDGRNRNIIYSIVALAKQLDLAIIAEGIEDSEQQTLVQGLNCEYGQGYLYSRPVPETKVLAVLQASDTRLPVVGREEKSASA